MTWGGGRYWYSNGVRWPGVVAFLLGLGASMLFSNSEMFESPLMTKYLGGTDLSFEAGMLFSGTLYYFMGGQRRQGGGNVTSRAEGSAL
jgi:NCS1 family nucleobase:cation symporter-1